MGNFEGLTIRDINPRSNDLDRLSTYRALGLTDEDELGSVLSRLGLELYEVDDAEREPVVVNAQSLANGNPVFVICPNSTPEGGPGGFNIFQPGPKSPYVTVTADFGLICEREDAETKAYFSV